jgi:hypothetical protein
MFSPSPTKNQTRSATFDGFVLTVLIAVVLGTTSLRHEPREGASAVPSRNEICVHQWAELWVYIIFPGRLELAAGILSTQRRGYGRGRMTTTLASLHRAHKERLKRLGRVPSAPVARQSIQQEAAPLPS